jgi:glycosyltransferase involved in cell wall biosynthesis
MMDELSDYIKDNSVLHGEISRQEEMYRLYKNCHAILMTSAYEGFPMLIKESMACACVPIVTALEGNKTHLKHQENALLISNPEDEPSVVDQGYKFISDLIGDNEHLKFLSGKARQYAIEHFDKTAFSNSYKRFLCNPLNFKN